MLWECFLPRAQRAGGQAGEVALSSTTVRQPVQLGGSHSSGHSSLGLGWTRPHRPRARPLQSQDCSLGWAGCGELGSVHPAGCWQEAGKHLYLSEPLPIFLPGMAPTNGPPVGNAQPCLRTSLQTWRFSIFFIRARLIEENSISRVGISSQRGA